jgi:hypothetical protein
MAKKITKEQEENAVEKLLGRSDSLPSKEQKFPKKKSDN